MTAVRIFEAQHITAAGKLLPFAEFRPFSDLPQTELSEPVKSALIANGEKHLGKEYEILKATDYLRFYRDGNRSVYESIYFTRRSAVLELLLAEYAERKGRFSEPLIDGVWHLLEETSWVVPAHMKTPEGEPFPLSPEYGESTRILDLFSAATGALLAWVYCLGRPFLDEAAPVVCERILFELNRRVINPFMLNDEHGWTGFGGHRVNNWTPWIVSNVLNACALCVKDGKLRENLTARALLMLDNFTAGYLPDGGCDEGPGYWTAAAASYLDALEVIFDMTGGKIDVFDVPLVRKMGEYIMSAHIHADYFIPFADAHPRLKIDYAMAARFGRWTGSKELETFGMNGYNTNGPNPLASTHPYRSIKDLFDNPAAGADYRHPSSVWLDGIQVMAQRQNGDTGNGLFLAAKGGHNAERHNHNDTGNFIVYADGEPLIIDVGVGTYCKATFSNDRYTIWSMRASYHNLPDINSFEQPHGRDYEAKSVVYNETGRSITMDLTAAYPTDAAVKSFVRAAELADGQIKITDSITLNIAGEITFNIMLADEPAIAAPGKIMLRGGHTLAFDPSLSAVVETIPLTDAGLHNDWQREQIYRLRLTAADVETGIYAVKVV